MRLPPLVCVGRLKSCSPSPWEMCLSLSRWISTTFSFTYINWTVLSILCNLHNEQNKNWTVLSSTLNFPLNWIWVPTGPSGAAKHSFLCSFSFILFVLRDALGGVYVPSSAVRGAPFCLVFLIFRPYANRRGVLTSGLGGANLLLLLNMSKPKAKQLKMVSVGWFWWAHGGTRLL